MIKIGGIPNNMKFDCNFDYTGCKTEKIKIESGSAELNGAAMEPGVTYDVNNGDVIKPTPRVNIVKGE